MFPYQTAEWGWRDFSNIPFSDKKRTLRILELPVLDYSASTLRPVLEDMLNEHAFKGTDPEGSGSKAGDSHPLDGHHAVWY